MPYYDCYLIPVRADRLEAYRAFSAEVAAVYREYGALRVVDLVLDPEGGEGESFHADGAREALGGTDLRDFAAAAATRAGETVIVSWTEWPSRALRDEALPRILADPRVQPADGQEVIFEGSRLIAGGFRPLSEA